MDLTDPAETDWMARGRREANSRTDTTDDELPEDGGDHEDERTTSNGEDTGQH